MGTRSDMLPKLYYLVPYTFNKEVGILITHFALTLSIHYHSNDLTIGL